MMEDYFTFHHLLFFVICVLYLYVIKKNDSVKYAMKK